MAKKEKKKSKKKDNPGADAVGAVRTAVEKTFHATADSVGGRAESTRTRAQDIVDEVAGAAGRLREMIEQLGVLEDLKKQVEALARRVQALEGGGASKPAASSAKSSGTTARKPAKARSTAAKSTSSRAKPAASKSASTSSRSTAAKKASSTTRKPASRSTSAKKPSSS
jgi:hypothetical protein